MRRALVNDGSNAGESPGSPSSVGCQFRQFSPEPERTFAMGAKVAAARGYRELVRADDDRRAQSLAMSRSRAMVQRESRSGIGSTPSPGPLGTRSLPSSITNGSVRSPSTPKKRSEAEQSPASVKPGRAATASNAAR